MHPDIKKFWEDAGYDIFGWYALNNSQILVVAGRDDILIERATMYYFNGNTYAEQEMLNLIKLKAFL
jgi:hypothetical protein